jgi:hypothetical protein
MDAGTKRALRPQEMLVGRGYYEQFRFFHATNDATAAMLKRDRGNRN